MFFDALKPFIYVGFREFYVFYPVYGLSPGPVAAPAFLRRRRVVAALDAAGFRKPRRRHSLHPRFRPRPRHPPVRTSARRRRPRLALLLDEPGRTYPGNLPAARAGITTQVRPGRTHRGKRETGNGKRVEYPLQSMAYSPSVLGICGPFALKGVWLLGCKTGRGGHQSVHRQSHRKQPACKPVYLRRFRAGAATFPYLCVFQGIPCWNARNTWATGRPA